MSISIRSIIKEPLVQFSILGGLLFLLSSYIHKQSEKQAREIVVDNTRIGLMVMNYKNQTGELPTKKQLDVLIENYIREEISYREATRMGLDKDDEIIRRRLSQKFDFLQTDLTEVNQPTEADLKKFYDDHLTLFKKEATVSFSHVYFSTDNSTEEVAKQKAIDVLQQIKSTNLQRAPEKGDRFPLQYDYTEQAQLDIQQNFGEKQMGEALFKEPMHTWVGPFKSGYGWHLLFISKRDEAATIPFISVKEDVNIKYMDAKKTEQNKKLFEGLGEKYIIRRAYLDTK